MSSNNVDVNITEQKTCLLCHSDKSCNMYTCEFGYEIHMCEVCGFLFAATHMAELSLHDLLKNGYADRAGELDFAWDEAHRFQAAQRRVDFLRSNLRSTISLNILEVGSYLGHFLKAVLDEGWDVQGIEPEFNTAQFSKDKTGALVYCGFVENFVKETLPHQFDGICLFHVLEHLVSPVDVLYGLRQLVKNDGWLCLEVPNGDLCGEGDWERFFNADETHLWFFSKRDLKVLLQRAGWQLVQVKTVPAYAGPKGASLVLAVAATPETVEVNNDPVLAQVTLKRLQRLRLKWLLWTRQIRFLSYNIKYAAWYLLKGWRKKSTNKR